MTRSAYLGTALILVACGTAKTRDATAPLSPAAQKVEVVKEAKSTCKKLGTAKARGKDADEQFEILRWLFWDNHKLTGYMATYRFNRAFTAAPDPAVLAFLRRRLDDFLGILDGHLQDRPFVIGDQPTIADISLMAYLSFPENETGYDLAVSHPAVRAWLSRLATLAGWQAPYDLLPGKRLHCYA